MSGRPSRCGCSPPACRPLRSARRNVASASRAQLFEQAVRIAVVALLVDRALPLGVEYGCAAVVLGNTVSELLSCLWMLLSWRRDLRRFPKAQEKEKVPAGYAAIVAPITATRGISSLLVTVENVLVPGQLALFCGSRSAALAQFGQLKGMAMPVLFFPFSPPSRPCCCPRLPRRTAREEKTSCGGW